MGSTQYLKKYLMYPHQIWYQKHQGMAKTKFEPCVLDLIFEVTEVIYGDVILKIVSAEHMKKYLMYPHQIWYTEASEHGGDEN